MNSNKCVVCHSPSSLRKELQPFETADIAVTSFPSSVQETHLHSNILTPPSAPCNTDCSTQDGCSTRPCTNSVSTSRSSAGITRSRSGTQETFQQRPSVDSNKPTVAYYAEKVVGTGSFGAVFRGRVVETGEVVAIKKVYHDNRYRNRELSILSQLRHPNIVLLRHAISTPSEKPGECDLNLVMNYMPGTMHEIIRSCEKGQRSMPLVHVKYYMYQTCRALGHIHSLGICHRDIKPQNLLVDPTTHTIQLCDFGSAKKLKPGDPNVSYICSRYYRAPELIFGSSDYSTSVDVWSLGCVFVELLLGRPCFVGGSGVEQLVEIIKVLGTPTTAQLESMNKNYCGEFQLPIIPPTPWENILGHLSSPETIDLVSRLLQFDPNQRPRPLDILSHPFFDELRQDGFTFSDLDSAPENLFNFTAEELATCTEEVLSILLPHWARHQFCEAHIMPLSEESSVQLLIKDERPGVITPQKIHQQSLIPREDMK